MEKNCIICAFFSINGKNCIICAFFSINGKDFTKMGSYIRQIMDAIPPFIILRMNHVLISDATAILIAKHI